MTDDKLREFVEGLTHDGCECEYGELGGEKISTCVGCAAQAALADSGTADTPPSTVTRDDSLQSLKELEYRVPNHMRVVEINPDTNQYLLVEPTEEMVRKIDAVVRELVRELTLSNTGVPTLIGNAVEKLAALAAAQPEKKEEL